MSRRSVELGIRDEKVAVGDHVAYFWENEEEFKEGVRFIEVGLRNNDHCVIFGYDQANEKVCKILNEHGFDTNALEAAGNLTMLGAAIDGDTTLNNIGAAFNSALNRGASMIRLLGNIGWGREGWPSEKDILAFEAKVTGAAKAFPSVIVCMYDVVMLSGHIIVHGAFETHPLTFCRNVLRENPYYVEFDKFMAGLAQCDTNK